MAMTVPHPIPYQGSKRSIADRILCHFPKNAIRLVEPFAGSAAISLAAAQQNLAQRFWINDAHTPIVDLWNAILGCPEKLALEYSELWHAQIGNEREYFNEVRNQFNKSHQPRHFLYLLARCVKAAIRYNNNGEFNNTPDNRRSGAKPLEMRSRILGASSLLASRTKTTCLDYRDVLAKCVATDLIYMDPPYQGVTKKRDNRYAPKIDHLEFQNELRKLNERGCMFIVSYDGRMGEKQYGEPLPKSLKLKHLEICAGRSTQATLLGLDHVTYESLYISEAIVHKLPSGPKKGREKQLTLV